MDKIKLLMVFAAILVGIELIMYISIKNLKDQLDAYVSHIRDIHLEMESYSRELRELKARLEKLEAAKSRVRTKKKKEEPKDDC